MQMMWTLTYRITYGPEATFAGVTEGGVISTSPDREHLEHMAKDLIETHEGFNVVTCDIKLATLSERRHYYRVRAWADAFDREYHKRHK